MTEETNGNEKLIEFPAMLRGAPTPMDAVLAQLVEVLTPVVASVQAANEARMLESLAATANFLAELEGTEAQVVIVMDRVNAILGYTGEGEGNG
jgi:hypothetical protein